MTTRKKPARARLHLEVSARTKRDAFRAARRRGTSLSKLVAEHIEDLAAVDALRKAHASIETL